VRAARLPATALSPVIGRHMPPPREGLSGPDLRRVLISEYSERLQARTNRAGRLAAFFGYVACSKSPL
jgi:hypothetical protein